jgi:hypothetical protein
VLFAIWANLHGGFLYGLVLIGFYIAGDVVGVLFDQPRRDHVAAAKRHGMLMGAALAGSCLNPSGPAILPHVMGYLGKTWLVDVTVEYRSPDFHGAYGREFLIALVLVMLALALVRRRMSWPHLVTLLGTSAFALHSMRNIPLWALTGLPLAVLHANSGWRRLRLTGLALVQRRFATGASAARTGLWTVLPAVALAILAARGGRLGGAQLLPNHFDPDTFPVRIVERARSAHVTGRMFNELAWGGYILTAWPEQRVFIDGQTDFYGEPLSQLYVSIRAAVPGWERRLDSLGVTLALLPEYAPLASAMARSTRWQMIDSLDGAARFGIARSR